MLDPAKPVKQFCGSRGTVFDPDIADRPKLDLLVSVMRRVPKECLAARPPPS